MNDGMDIDAELLESMMKDKGACVSRGGKRKQTEGWRQGNVRRIGTSAQEGALSKVSNK
jgi:hypothetical protein